MSSPNISIQERVIHILKKIKNITDEMMGQEDLLKPLTGLHFKLSGTDLVYLMLELEEEFEIKIPAELLSDYQFSSINKICKVIQQLL